MAINYQKIIGALLLVVMFSGAIYVSFDDKVKIRVDEDKSTFYVKEDSRWVVSGREYNKLMDGTSQLYRRSSKINVSVTYNDSTITIKRVTPYIRGPVIVDTYYFKGSIDDVELFPISHQVEVFNGSGYFYRYEVRNLVYDGPTYKLAGQTVLEFGRNMKLELEPDYRWSWVYKKGTVRTQYDIPSDYEVFNVRLFDPEVTTFNNSLATEDLNFTGNQNVTRYLSLPKTANVTSATLDITGKSNESNVAFGSGSDGALTFTGTGADTFGNLVEGTDYTNNSNTIFLNLNQEYNFTTFVIGPGKTLSTLNTSGAVLYISATLTMNLSGDVDLTNILDQADFDNPVTLRGVIFNTSGVADGGGGGSGGTATAGAATGSGGGSSSQLLGWGGGAGGGGAAVADGTARAGNGGSGGTGGASPAGGSGGSCSGDCSASGSNGGESGGGGGGVAQEDHGASGQSGGNGAGTHDTTGTTGTVSCGTGEEEASGGGGGGGGSAGTSGIQFYIQSNQIIFSGTLDTSGTAGGNAGFGGFGNSCSDDGDAAGAAGGGGAGGGGGGNAGNVTFLYAVVKFVWFIKSMVELYN